MADCSAGLVAHLQADHPGELAALARVVAGLLPPAAAALGGHPRPPVLVAIDSAGTRWRCVTSGGDVDARLDFPAPVAWVAGLHAALRDLAAAAGAGHPGRAWDCAAGEGPPPGRRVGADRQRRPRGPRAAERQEPT